MIIDPLHRNHVTVTTAAGGKGTIVFAHGFGTDQTAWEAVAAAFRDEYTVVLFDNVGGGRADPAAYSPVRYSSLTAYAQDLLDICAALSLQKAYFVGHSVGSMIGLLAALKSPALFQKMVFVGASPRYLNDQNYFGGFEQQDLDHLFEAMQENYFLWASGFAPMAMANAKTPHLAAFFYSTLAAIRPDISLEVSKVIFSSDIRAELPKLNVPSLIVQSRQDPVVPRQVAYYLKDNIPNSQLAEIKADGHLPHISHPEEVIKVLKYFL